MLDVPQEELDAMSREEVYELGISEFNIPIKLIETGSHREMIQGDGFFISYNVCLSGPTGTETALVDTRGKKNAFYILNGKWVEAYRPLVPQGFDVCKAFFDEHDNGHFWSD